MQLSLSENSFVMLKNNNYIENELFIDWMVDNSHLLCGFIYVKKTLSWSMP